MTGLEVPSGNGAKAGNAALQLPPQGKADFSVFARCCHFRGPSRLHTSLHTSPSRRKGCWRVQHNCLCKGKVLPPQNPSLKETFTASLMRLAIPPPWQLLGSAGKDLAKQGVGLTSPKKLVYITRLNKLMLTHRNCQVDATVSSSAHAVNIKCKWSTSTQHGQGHAFATSILYPFPQPLVFLTARTPLTKPVSSY